jgi:hypothetical protein
LSNKSEPVTEIAQTQDSTGIQVDAVGQVIGPNVPKTDSCSVCHGHAKRLSSAWQGEGIAYHNYRCRTEECPAGGTIIEHDDGDNHRVGPVFGGRDLAVHLATRDRPEVPSETGEVAP